MQKSICDVWTLCLVLTLAISHVSAFTFSRGIGAEQCQQGSFPLTSSRTKSTQLQGVKGFWPWFFREFPETPVSVNPYTTSQEFDHVLIDVNQVLHSALNRPTGLEGHARLLMAELNRIVKFITPTKSLVLAIDGPPSAAKLSPKRRQRNRLFQKLAWKLENLQTLKLPPDRILKKREKYANDVKRSCLSPGLDILKLMESTILYWAWNSIQTNANNLQNVKIYVSSSAVPGEGEIKLLEWVQQKPRNGESIVFYTNDSDMLLAGLFIPPSSTHNVFIAQKWPGKYMSWSLWETTRQLQSWIPPFAPQHQMLQTRTDLAVLAVLSGNDFFPPLQGKGNMKDYRAIYQRLVRDFYSNADKYGITNDTLVGFVDPDTLQFNVDFCIAFFQAVCTSFPTNMYPDSNSTPDDADIPLQRLQMLSDSGFIPKFQIEVLRYIENENGKWVECDDNEISDSKNTRRKMSLTMGERGSEDFREYTKWIDDQASSRVVRRELSDRALSDLSADNEALDDLGYDAYKWEIPVSVQGHVQKYLGGILWLLQTYQDGVCANYNYDYGRRLTPTPEELYDFFLQAKEKKLSLGMQDLLNTTYGPPVSADICCLAGFPSEMRPLFTDSYSLLSDEQVESFYEESLDPIDNSLNLTLFATLCENEINKLQQGRKTRYGKTTLEGQESHSRTLESKSWVVINRSQKPILNPFTPPHVPVRHFRRLPKSPFIQVSRRDATDTPRPRSEKTSQRSQFLEFLKKHGHLNNIQYRVDFPGVRGTSSPILGNADSIANMEDVFNLDVTKKSKNVQAGGNDMDDMPLGDESNETNVNYTVQKSNGDDSETHNHDTSTNTVDNQGSNDGTHFKCRDDNGNDTLLGTTFVAQKPEFHSTQSGDFWNEGMKSRDTSGSSSPAVQITTNASATEEQMIITGSDESRNMNAEQHDLENTSSPESCNLHGGSNVEDQADGTRESLGEQVSVCQKGRIQN